MYFIFFLLFDENVNEIVFLASLSDRSLMYKMKQSFCILIYILQLDWNYYLNGILVVYLGFSVYSIMSFANRDSFTSSILIQIPFISYFLAKLIRIGRSNTMLNRSNESGCPCLLSDFKGNVFSFSLFCMMLAVDIVYGFYYVEVYPLNPGGSHGNPLQYSCLENPHGQMDGLQPMESQRLRHDWVIKHAGMYVHSIPILLRVFLINGCWILLKVFSSTEMIICFLLLSLIMWHITLIDLQILNPSFTLGKNPTSSRYVLPLIHCWIQFGNILLRISIYVLQGYHPIILFSCSILVLFYYQGNAGLTRLVLEYSLMFINLRKLSTKELMLLNCGVGEDSWESLGLQRDPTSPS